MMPGMDPALAGFLGGLLGGVIPSAVAFPVARYQVRAERKRNDGAMYAEYVDAAARFADLLEELARLKAERRVQRRRKDELELTHDVGGLSELHVDMQEIEQEYRQLLGRVEERGDALGLIRRRMDVFESERFGQMRDRLDNHLSEFHDLCVRGDPPPSPEEIRLGKRDVDDLAHELLLEASRETAAGLLGRVFKRER